MNDQAVDLTLCDREPIHIPGLIQPHGVLLVVDPHSLTITHAAGDVANSLGCVDWLRARLADVLGDPAAREAQAAVGAGEARACDRLVPPHVRAAFDIRFQPSGRWLIVELEPAPAMPMPGLLPRLEAAAAAFERSVDLQELYDRWRSSSAA